MDYFLDTEFDGFGGPLLSLALVREDARSLYIIYDSVNAKCPWVLENVVPVMSAVPPHIILNRCNHQEGAKRIQAFLKDDPSPHIITDWPEDVRCFSQAIITSPGRMVTIENLTIQIRLIKAYPTDLPGAVRHNAWWDAMALRSKLLPVDSMP